MATESKKPPIVTNPNELAEDWGGPLPGAYVSGMTKSQKELIQKLCDELDQLHMFDGWALLSPAVRRQLAEELEALDKSYKNGGLVGYIKNAKSLLEASQKGVNPLDGWEPTIPQGETFEVGTPEYISTEESGLNEIGKVGFVLVAGGLGERLGYNGIKVALPTELATETCYLEYYCQYILNIQKKYRSGNEKVPLCIMVSKDTHDLTIELLKQKDYFGLEESQVTIVQQGRGVPALLNNKAHIAMDGPNIITKPHGHGDIHQLLYTEGVAKRWYKRMGVRWLCFFQDTNGLAFHTLPLMLGVSKKLDLVMNSLCVPRKAKQAIGGIARLQSKEDPDLFRTINVEYNQLDPLLRASGFPDGDVNDKDTGFSPYPGNINQLLFRLDKYIEALDESQGIMPDFVNPKYKDEKKTTFKKPARLECMMQDFPTVLSGEDAKKVGFTTISADMCFSPVKNATKDGVALQNKGSPPGVAATGEADQYGAFRKMLKAIGCQIEEREEVTFDGIKVTLGPEIVLNPSFACCLTQMKEVFPKPDQVKISAKSSLVVSGADVVIESLNLDGALVIDCPKGSKMHLKNLEITNKGWMLVPAEEDSPEFIKMRGYDLIKTETCRMVPSESTNACTIL